MRHFFFLPSKIKVLNFIKRERLKQVFLSHSKSSRVLLIFVVPLNLKTLKLLRFPRQKHSQLPSTLVCLLNLHNQWNKMASRWPLLIQTSLSGEMRSWRCLPSPWLVSRATRRITILYLDTKHTSKFFFPWCVIFPCNNQNALFYLLKCVPPLQFYNYSARIAKPVCYLAFFFWDYSRYCYQTETQNKSIAAWSTSESIHRQRAELRSISLNKTNIVIISYQKILPFIIK